jgi:multidrug efflux pump subunit AcrB
MTTFNLSDWALRHRSFVFYLMLVAAIAGLFSYRNLGREEDPPFTIKTMVVKTVWPGATTLDTVDQITDRIEKKLEEIPGLDYVRSYTKPGESVVFVNLRDTVSADDVEASWYQVRKKVDDLRAEMPSGVQGPYFDDEFGDTYSFIFGLTGDGLSHRELKDVATDLRAEFLGLPGVSKVDLVGTQDERIYLEFSTRRLAALGLDLSTLSQLLQAQNALVPSGSVDAGPERILVRVSGAFTSEASLAAINLHVDDRYLPLSEIAAIKRGPPEPEEPAFRVDGAQAIGIAIAMEPGGNALALGDAVRARAEALTADLPIGLDLHAVADQSHVVEEAVSEFSKSLTEAVAIVLAVSFLALGIRAGIIVTIAIPLVLAITFVAMDYLGISLQRISLGALIIALGLLVDDAMIAVETMIAKMEEGSDRISAATHAYTSTAFPMLTGTLVTIIGFVPVGFAKSGAGEYCYSLFAVVGIALIVSWLVAVLFTPLTGVAILPRTLPPHKRSHKAPGGRFRAVLAWSLRHRLAVLAATAAIFGCALIGATQVPQQFFPRSDRPELLLDLTLPRSASIAETRAAVERVESLLATDPDIDHSSFYVGQGAVRFYLPLDTQLANDFFAQAVIVTKGFEQRDAVAQRLETALDRDFSDILTRITPLELGPPVGWPIKYRLSGPDPEMVRTLSQGLAAVLAGNPDVRNINYDWNETAKSVTVEIDQDRARPLGITSQQLAEDINAILSGTTMTQMRDGTYLVDIVARAVPEERASLETLRNLSLDTPGGRQVPLGQIATLSYGTEPPLIWRRNRLATVTVLADTAPGRIDTAVIADLAPAIDAYRATLPLGYSITLGGVSEDSARAQASIFAVAPLMLFLMATVLMMQLMSLQRLFLVFLTAPLALIGVVAAMLLSGAPMGFVAILGVLSLTGMVIRNSVILISRIDDRIAAGEGAVPAIISATEDRLRPILLTAAAAILGMIPIAPTVFWGPMAYAVMGGLAVATLLTLIVLPVLYAAWFGLPGE